MTEVSPLLQWINAHPHLSGLATFIISAAESIAIIGTIIPGSIMMTAIGTLAGAGVIPLWSTIIWAILGAIVGDGISYWMGFYFKDRLNFIWPFKNHAYLLENGERFFLKYGWMSVFIGRFVGPVRALVPLVAGMMGMKPSRFIFANVLSAIGWAPAYMLPGILLGAASLELPPDIAVQVILMLLLFSFFIIFCVWLLKKLFNLIGNQIEQFLNWIWNNLYHSRYFTLITKVLKHHDANKTHGQLPLAFYLIITFIAFFYLTTYVLVTPSPNIFINNIFFHLFRSLRTPTVDDIALYLTLLGQKEIVFVAMFSIFVWLAVKKNWHSAWHIFGLIIFSAGSIWGIKHLVKGPRPWGIIHNTAETYAYPSGHSTLSAIFFIGLALVIVKNIRIKNRFSWIIYSLGILVALLVAISRLYLGAHWFTDVIGAWLLAAILLMIISLSYNRKAEPNFKIRGVLIVALLSFLMAYLWVVHSHFSKFKQGYTQASWPLHTISEQDWWQQKNKILPPYRINRFGMRGEIFTLQWLGDLNQIKNLLLNNDWEEQPERSWISILRRISGVESTRDLPLVSPLHLDKPPVLVMVKYIDKQKKLIVLRLWDSHIQIDTLGKLWVGSIELIPRTYSWLLKRSETQVPVSSNIIFKKLPTTYAVKPMWVTIHRKNKTISSKIILLLKNPLYGV